MEQVQNTCIVLMQAHMCLATWSPKFCATILVFDPFLTLTLITDDRFERMTCSPILLILTSSLMNERIQTFRFPSKSVRSLMNERTQTYPL